MIRVSDALLSIILDHPRHSQGMANALAAETNPLLQERAVERYYRLELLGRGAPGNELQTALLNKAVEKASWPILTEKLKQALSSQLKIEILTEPGQELIPTQKTEQKDDIIFL